MANKKLSLKVLTEQKPVLGSYEPALSPKTKPNSFSHPEDALDLEQTVTNIINNYITNNSFFISVINNIINQSALTLEQNFIILNGANAASAPVLSPEKLYIGDGGSLNQGAALPTNPSGNTQIFIINSSGGDRTIWGNTSNQSIIYSGSWLSAASQKTLSSDSGIIHKFTYVILGGSGRWIHEEITMV